MPLPFNLNLFQKQLLIPNLTSSYHPHFTYQLPTYLHKPCFTFKKYISHFILNHNNFIFSFLHLYSNYQPSISHAKSQLSTFQPFRYPSKNQLINPSPNHIFTSQLNFLHYFHNYTINQFSIINHSYHSKYKFTNFIFTQSNHSHFLTHPSYK